MIRRGAARGSTVRLLLLAAALLAGGSSARDVARLLAAEHGLSRNDAYRLAHEAGAAATTSESTSESE